jgi:heme a synthase
VQVSSASLLRRLALLQLVANVGIVITGGAVRLTGSGLGCPTWPKCTSSSYVTTAARGYHGEIEFGNRLLTWVIGGLAVACLAVAFAQRRRIGGGTRLRWAAIVFAGVPAQAVLGGFTVLTKLNPWLVAAHFLLSIAIITASYQLWTATREVTAVPGPPLSGALRTLLALVVAVTVAVLTVGTVVTGSGPHAGDVHAKRTGLDPATVAQLHADLVMLLIGLTVALWLALRTTDLARAAGTLLAVELGQGVVGFTQYFTHLPILLVGLHMAGACAVWLAVLNLLTASARSPRYAPIPHPLDQARDAVNA